MRFSCMRMWSRLFSALHLHVQQLHVPGMRFMRGYNWVYARHVRAELRV